MRSVAIDHMCCKSPPCCFADDKSDYDSVNTGANIGPKVFANVAADGRVYGIVGAKAAAEAGASSTAAVKKTTRDSNTVTAGITNNLNAAASGIAALNRNDNGNPRTEAVPSLTALAGYLG